MKVYGSMNVSEARFFSLGMNMLSKDQSASRSYEKNSYNLRLFKESFGSSPLVLYKVWCLMIQNDVARDMYPNHLLWCCFFLKVYGLEGCNARFAGVSEKTFRKWVQRALKALEELEHHVVRRVFCFAPIFLIALIYPLKR